MDPGVLGKIWVPSPGTQPEIRGLLGLNLEVPVPDPLSGFIFFSQQFSKAHVKNSTKLQTIFKTHSKNEHIGE